MLKQVRKKRAYEDIVTQIRTLIEKGKLKQGDLLPNEKELSETFKVSRSTVREAVLSLEMLHLVERRQGDGTYVMATSEEAIVKPLAASIFHEKDDIIDVFTLRRILEPEIAGLAADRSNPKDIKVLEEIVEKQQQTMASGKSAVMTDSNFHYALARMSGNKVLERLLVALVRLLRKTREAYLQTDERKQKSLAGHRDILNAIKAGNGTMARQAMRRHLEEVENTLFKKNGETSPGNH